MKRTLVFLTSTICALWSLSALSDSWPIVFTSLTIDRSAFKKIDKNAPDDCQPEHFDPRKSALHFDKSSGFYSLTGSDADESVSVQINGWLKQDDSIVALPRPFSLTKYAFECMSTSSQVFVFENNKDRHALYTHIETARFSPDLNTLVMFNYFKIGKQKWEQKRRITDYKTKKYSHLPLIDETSYLADVTNAYVVTYGSATRPPSEYRNRRRIVSIWGLDGKLKRAIYVPIQDTAANAYDSDDGIGMLPNEQTTFYHLTRTGKNICTLRLQDVTAQEKHRAIQLNVPGEEWDPAAVGMRVQVNLNDLRLQGGSVRYRISPSGRGDVTNDWNPWRVAR